MKKSKELIWTIGRAARNVDGKVVLYADKETKSIKKAIAETDRRRKIQLAYNKKHKIDAKSVKKEISDILESVYEKDYVKVSEGSNVGGNLKKHLKALDKKMKESASNLEFEEAAKIRDEIRKLESTELEITLNPKIRQYDVKNNKFGIASKDLSRAIIENSEFEENKIQLSTYKKNWRYGDSGFIEIKKSKFIALKNDIISDEKGIINIISSNFKGEISKKGNVNIN